MADTAAFVDIRSTEILLAAKLAFAEKGFDGASMQDLARAAGMSAGNFYRYFPSKNAIVAAMIARDLTDLQSDFEIIQTSGDPTAALLEKFRFRIDNLEECDGPLWAEIDAAALRNPEIGTVVDRMEAQIASLLIQVFARISGLSPEHCARRFSGEAAYLVMVFKGASQRLSGRGCQLPDITRKSLRLLILQTIAQTVASIAAEHLAAKKG